jgi:hypothetical protein
LLNAATLRVRFRACEIVPAPVTVSLARWAASTTSANDTTDERPRPRNEARTMLRLLFLSSLICMAPVGDGGAGGSGAPAGGGADEEKPLTRAEVTSLINTTVTGAITSHTKRLTGEIKTMLGTELKAALAAAKAEDGGEEQPTGEDKPKGGNAKVDPAVAKLQRELDAMKTTATENERKASDAEQRSRMTAAENAIRGGLAGKVRPEAMGLAIDALKARGAITFAEDGTPQIKIPYASTKGARAEHTEFDVETGLAEFLKSPEAAVLVPAPSGGGSGSPRAPGGHRPGTFDRTKPLAQWSEAERASYMEERSKDIAEAQSKNPLGS